MIEITFQSKNDAISLFKIIKQQLPEEEQGKILLGEDRYIFTITLPNNCDRVLTDGLCQFIYGPKKDDWFINVLKQRFYYEDPEEQQEITYIFYSILEGNRKGLKSFLCNPEDENLVPEAVGQMVVENACFSFDSFVQFRLRQYLKLLENYAEIAIDEYKMEQEYQMFVQTLRDFLSRQPSSYTCIHAVFDDEITFYTGQFIPIKKNELIKMIDRRLLINHPVYVDSVSIAPLLSIAPESILIYTKDRDQPLIRTIQNIFEERVVIKNLTEFPESIAADRETSAANDTN